MIHIGEVAGLENYPEDPSTVLDHFEGGDLYLEEAEFYISDSMYDQHQHGLFVSLVEQLDKQIENHEVFLSSKDKLAEKRSELFADRVIYEIYRDNSDEAARYLGLYKTDEGNIVHRNVTETKDKIRIFRAVMDKGDTNVLAYLGDLRAEVEQTNDLNLLADYLCEEIRAGFAVRDNITALKVLSNHKSAYNIKTKCTDVVLDALLLAAKYKNAVGIEQLEEGASEIGLSLTDEVRYKVAMAMNADYQTMLSTLPRKMQRQIKSGTVTDKAVMELQKNFPWLPNLDRHLAFVQVWSALTGNYPSSINDSTICYIASTTLDLLITGRDSNKVNFLEIASPGFQKSFLKPMVELAGALYENSIESGSMPDTYRLTALGVRSGQPVWLNKNGNKLGTEATLNAFVANSDKRDWPEEKLMVTARQLALHEAGNEAVADGLKLRTKLQAELDLISAERTDRQRTISKDVIDVIGFRTTYNRAFEELAKKTEQLSSITERLFILSEIVTAQKLHDRDSDDSSYQEMRANLLWLVEKCSTSKIARLTVSEAEIQQIIEEHGVQE